MYRQRGARHCGRPRVRGRPVAHGRARAAVLVAGVVVLALCASASATASAPAGAAPAVGAAAGERGVRSHTWAWPLAPPWRVLRPFEAPPTRYSAGHRGIDLAAAAGQEVLAPAAAMVYFTGHVAGRPVITLQPADGVLVSMEPVASALRAGDEVPRRGSVGTVAAGGHCDGACLHLGVRVNGEYVSPLLYFGGVPRAVLLPIVTEPAGRQARGWASR